MNWTFWLAVLVGMLVAWVVVLGVTILFSLSPGAEFLLGVFLGILCTLPAFHWFDW